MKILGLIISIIFGCLFYLLLSRGKIIPFLILLFLSIIIHLAFLRQKIMNLKETIYDFTFLILGFILGIIFNRFTENYFGIIALIVFFIMAVFKIGEGIKSYYSEL